MSVLKRLGLGLGGLVLFLGSGACSPKVVVDSPDAAGGRSSGAAGASGRGNSSGAGGRIGTAGSGATDPGSAGSGPALGTLLETDKVDLLFMIDNSASMADKQALLKDAIPFLLQRLTSPRCVDSSGDPTGDSAADGSCPKNSTPEFPAVADIHLGIVSSSLGAHGGAVCSTGAAADHLDDQAHLIATMRSELSVSETWNDSGFLAWDPTGDRNNPPGESDAKQLAKSFQDQITATGEHGCGYEASLESWYRFLIDPEPPATVTLDAATNSTTRSSFLTVDAGGGVVIDPATGKPECTGCDETLLAQRAAFLRPDSLVAIVMLSDENDCSIRDDGVGWFVGSTSRMPRATEICDTDPNNPCCRSCAQREDTPPAGCFALSNDKSCKDKPASMAYTTWDTLHDSLNLRCYKQHQRFGFDLLYPTSRYVDALQQVQLPLQSNPNVTVQNPLYDPGDTGKRRDSSLVVLAGIVGVPWQDLADDASQTGAGLSYLSASELDQRSRWEYLLGTPDASPVVPPNDPFMIETTDERSGSNQLASPPVAITGAKSMNPGANVINGHEQNIPGLDDLQYACIFPFAKPRDCTAGDASCSCAPDKAGNTDAIVAANSPICQPPEGGPPTSTEYYAKAYPGTRELQVLKDVGEMAVVASICPKVLKSADVDYGYNPAMNAIVDRMKVALRPRE